VAPSWREPKLRLVPALERFGPIKSNAERRVAQLLSDVNLGEPATCFYSVHLPRHEYKRMSEIDFLIAVEGLLLVIEVKGGRLARHDGLWTFTDRFGDVHEKREGPFDQARTARFALEDSMKERLLGLQFDYGWAVITPDQTLAPDLEWNSAEYIGQQYMTVTGMESALRSSIRHWRAKCRHRSHSSRQDVEALLRPDFDRVLKPSLLSGTLEKEYIRLALEQYDSLRGGEGNPRIFVTGGAGSGKTLLAVETAKRAAQDGSNVLLTCKSPAVIDVMQSGLDGSAVKCVPYDQTASLSPADVLVVDEGQDLTNVADFLHLDELVIGGIEQGKWRIFSDPNNQLNLDGEYDPAVAEEFRSHASQYHLSYNCRNTKPIVTQTQLITGADLGVARVGEGPSVEFREYASEADAANLIDAHLKNLRKDEVAVADIAIITLRDSTEDSAAMLTKAYRRGQISRGDPHRPRAETATLTTASQMKGLEAAHVLLIDVDDLSTPRQIARLYVGMTRPRISLWVCVSSLAWNQLAAGLQRESETA
jgi:Nuclease-related domain/Uncharacterized conserved protein (DUF2075)